MNVSQPTRAQSHEQSEAKQLSEQEAYALACLKKVVDVSNKHYPNEARGQLYGKVTVTLTVLPSGKLANVRLDKSSGHKILDDALLDSVRRAAPFAAFTPAMKQATDIVEITAPFDYGRTQHER